MTLKQRWKKKESKLGQALKTWVSYFFLTLAAVGGLVDITIGFPEGWIPLWVKTTIAISALVSHVVGKLTVKKVDSVKSDLPVDTSNSDSVPQQ